MPTPSVRERSPRGRPPALMGLLPVAVLCTSCAADGLNEVHGKVLHKGQPAKGAVVVFHPQADRGMETVRPTGVVSEDGSFTLSDHTGKKGAAVGKYAVTITWPEEPKAAQRPKRGTAVEAATLPDRLGGRYVDPGRSKLVVEVKPGVNQLEPFDLR